MPPDLPRVAALTTGLVPWHLGALHPYEQALVLALAFGPFVVLGVVVFVVRRRDIREEERRNHADPS